MRRSPLPTENAAKIAVRTQQILAYESGVADTVDPFAGSYFVEALTDEIEQRAAELIQKVDELGGAVQAIDFIKAEIEESAFGYHERYRPGQDTVVGVNRFVEDDVQVPDIMRVDPAPTDRSSRCSSAGTSNCPARLQGRDGGARMQDMLPAASPQGPVHPRDAQPHLRPYQPTTGRVAAFGLLLSYPLITIAAEASTPS